MEGIIVNNNYNFYNDVASLWDYAINPLPKRYLDLIIKRFNINKNSSVIDLGCGSGGLPISLSSFSNNVIGLDFSEEMLRLAKNRDDNHHVRWILSGVEEYDFGVNAFDLIISLEAFHLFSGKEHLFKRCANALKKNAHFCVGWISYHWELRFVDLYSKIFEYYGIDWGEDANLAIFDLGALTYNDISFSPVIREMIKVKSEISPRKIAAFLASTHKSSALSNNKRMALLYDLEIAISQKLHSENSCGYDICNIYYTQKVDK